MYNTAWKKKYTPVHVIFSRGWRNSWSSFYLRAADRKTERSFKNLMTETEVDIFMNKFKEKNRCHLRSRDFLQDSDLFSFLTPPPPPPPRVCWPRRGGEGGACHCRRLPTEKEKYWIRSELSTSNKKISITVVPVFTNK